MSLQAAGGWTKQEWSPDTVASFLLFPPQLGDIKLDLKGASSRCASGLVVLDSQNHQNACEGRKVIQTAVPARLDFGGGKEQGAEGESETGKRAELFLCSSFWTT